MVLNGTCKETSTLPPAPQGHAQICMPAGKFGGLFASLPQAMVSGLFCVMFSIIAAIGISQVQFIDLNSPRNIFILGFGLYMSLSVQVRACPS